ncbi:hypothetical protein VTO42DRAFT_663 [Malbranchea cinnamomea]
MNNVNARHMRMKPDMPTSCGAWCIGLAEAALDQRSVRCNWWIGSDFDEELNDAMGLEVPKSPSGIIIGNPSRSASWLPEDLVKVGDEELADYLQ